MRIVPNVCYVSCYESYDSIHAYVQTVFVSRCVNCVTNKGKYKQKYVKCVLKRLVLSRYPRPCCPTDKRGGSARVVLVR